MKLWEALKALDEGKEVEYRYRLTVGTEFPWERFAVEANTLLDCHAASRTHEFRLKPAPPMTLAEAARSGCKCSLGIDTFYWSQNGTFCSESTGAPAFVTRDMLTATDWEVL